MTNPINFLHRFPPGCEFERVLSDYAQRHPLDGAMLARVFRITRGGGTLTECREGAGLSLGQAARVTGIARPRLVELEAGADPTLEEARRLLDSYCVPGWVR